MPKTVKGAKGAKTVTTAASLPLGYVVYRGPSAFDGKPIVVIVTGVKRPSKNPKTGPMAQTYILREDIDPLSALKSGDDRSVCWMCPFASGNGCYVRVFDAPLSIWRAYHRGRYVTVRPSVVADILRARGMGLRMGSYGDPMAAPLDIWMAMSKGIKAWTGYTHAWRDAPAGWSNILMASADVAGDREDAHKLGWRTFRVRHGASDVVGAREIICPASEEFKATRGRVVACIDCGLCAGASRPAADIAILDHGRLAKATLPASDVPSFRALPMVRS